MYKSNERARTNIAQKLAKNSNPNNEIKLTTSAYPTERETSQRKQTLLKRITLVFLLSVMLGAGLGLWYRQNWIVYQPTDKAFSAGFRQKPIQMGFPKPADYSFVRDDSIKIYSLKGDFGIDEINRFDVIESPDAADEWLKKTVQQTKGQIIGGSSEGQARANDFKLFLPENAVYLRGRILFAREGNGIYKIFVIRASEEELDSLDAVRFLYGLKFTKN